MAGFPGSTGRPVFAAHRGIAARHTVSGGHYFWINSGVGQFIGCLVAAVNIIGMLVLVVVGHLGHVEILGSRIDPCRKIRPARLHPDPTGGASRKLLAEIASSARERERQGRCLESIFGHK
jgi:hypothetical protein